MMFQIASPRTFSILTLSSFAAIAATACSAPAIEEEAATSDSAFSTRDFPRSCAVADVPHDGAVWVNYRSEAIGCGNVNPVGDGASNEFGDTVKGRTLCMIRWLRDNQPAVFNRLGRVTEGERHFVDGTRAGEAWVVDFASGSRVQFQWEGPCGGDLEGYLKLYYKPGPEGASLPPLPQSLKGCAFDLTSRIPNGDTNGHITFQSDNCGVAIDEWYWGNLASNKTTTMRYGGHEVRVEHELQSRNGEARYVPVRWDSVVGDAAKTYAYALGALEHKGRLVDRTGSVSNPVSCGAAAAGLGAGLLGATKSCFAGPVPCAVDVLWTLSGTLAVKSSC